MNDRAERLRREVWRWLRLAREDLPARRLVTENARTLRFDTHEFESE
jgi:hypothetical protein